MRKYLLLIIISTTLAVNQNLERRHVNYGNEMTLESLPDTVAKEIWNEYRKKYDDKEIDMIDFTWQDLKEGSFVYKIDVNDDSVFEFYIEAGAKDSIGMQVLRSIGGNGDNYIFQKKGNQYSKICEFEGSTGWLGDNKINGYRNFYGWIHMSFDSGIRTLYKWNGEKYIKIKTESVFGYKEYMLTLRQANELGLKLLKENKTNEVIELWDRAYMYFHEDGWSELANNLGYVYYKAGDYSNAIDVLYKVIKRDSLRALAYHNLAEVYEAMSDTNSAIENYKKYLALDSLSNRAERIRRKIDLWNK